HLERPDGRETAARSGGGRAVRRRVATARQLEGARKKASALCEGVGDIIADHGPMAVEAVCEQGVSWFTPAESTGAVAAEARSDQGVSWSTAHQEEQHAQAALLRDIFGNPFRPLKVGGG